MKYLNRILIFFLLMIVMPLFSQNNLFENSGFENWSTSPFGISCEDWTMPFGMANKETADIKEGSTALKVVSSPQKLNSVSQSLGTAADFVPGQTFVLTINYKVLTSQGGNDIALACYWNSNRDGMLKHDSLKLNTAYFTSVDWKQLSIETSVPEGASSFEFIMNIPKDVVVLFDDFSFVQKSTDEPYLNLSTETFAKATAYKGETYKFPTLSMTYANVGKINSLEITGSNRDQFTIDTTRVSASQLNIDIVYAPNKIGNHKASLIIDVDSTRFTKTLPLSGVSIDKDAKPLITVAPGIVPTFETKVGVDSVFALTLTSENCIEDIKVEIIHQKGAAFTISNSLVSKNTTSPMSVTFKPTSVGDYESTLLFSTRGADTVEVKLLGKGLEKEVIVIDYDTVFSLNLTEPMPLLYEKFDGVEHNKTLSLDRWSNVVIAGERPWWGYVEKDDKGKEVDRYAKATAYQYQIKDDDVWEMWIVTPPLDFKNAKSKMFTFRVMGDLMFEKHDTKFDLYYIDSIPGENTYFGKVDVQMPATPDLNGEWTEIHMDLTGQNISDVFFMAFRYYGKTGESNTVTYYIDDVSFGRTDLPVITVDVNKIEKEAALGVETIIAKVNVTAANLQNPVSLSVKGSNPSNFELSTKQLPVEGGEFVVKFKSDKEGVHEAYIKLSSRGAADKYIPMAVLNKIKTSIDNTHLSSSLAWAADSYVWINVAADSKYAIYDINGRMLYGGELLDGDNCLPHPLSAGIYVIRVNTGDRIEYHKIVVR